MSTERPLFPPLLTGIAVTADADPVAAALGMADDAEPGTVVYAKDDDALRLALILAPDRPLEQAAGVGFVPMLGLNDALGALAPPEVGLHIEWPGTVRINGAKAGAFRMLADTNIPTTEPDWLIIGLTLSLRDPATTAPGETPDQTTLADEGCGELLVVDLIEAWARHMMNWLHTYMSDGFAPVARAWWSLAWQREDAVEAPETGTFLGLDDLGGMILKTDAGTKGLPLWKTVETP